MKGVWKLFPGHPHRGDLHKSISSYDTRKEETDSVNPHVIYR